MNNLDRFLRGLELLMPPPESGVSLETWPGSHVYRDGCNVFICERPETQFEQARRDRAALIELLQVLPAWCIAHIAPTAFLGDTTDGRSVYCQPYFECYGGDWNKLEPFTVFEERLKMRLRDVLLKDPEYLQFQVTFEEGLSKLRSSHPEWEEVMNDTPQLDRPEVGWFDVRQDSGAHWILIDPVAVWAKRSPRRGAGNTLRGNKPLG